MKPEISIIMPVKNAASYLVECLDSILGQSFENWELLAVNDASTDESPKIIEKYQKKDSRIHLFENKESGIIPALQTAYGHVSGSYIHRMDADDIMVKNKLEVLYNLALENGQGIVATGHVKYFSEEGVGEGYKKYEKWLNMLCDKNRHWQEIYKECVIASPCWLVHKNDFEKCRGFNSAIYPEDYDLVFRFYQYGLKVVSTSEVLHLWRDHTSRTSRNHIHYQQNAFFKIKLLYFFQLDRDKSRPLVIWGAGKKGKIMAKLLKAKNEKFSWVSNNPNKNGLEIHDKILESYKTIVTKNHPQVIITVAQKNAQKEITTFLHKNGLKEREDYYMFR